MCQPAHNPEGLAPKLVCLTSFPATHGHGHLNPLKFNPIKITVPLPHQTHFKSTNSHVRLVAAAEHFHRHRKFFYWTARVIYLNLDTHRLPASHPCPHALSPEALSEHSRLGSTENCPQSVGVTPTLQEGNFAVMVTPNRSSSAPVADWMCVTSGKALSDLGSHPHFSNGSGGSHKSNTLSTAAQLLKLGYSTGMSASEVYTLLIKLPRAWPPGFFLDSPGGLILLSLGQERTRWTGETQALRLTLLLVPSRSEEEWTSLLGLCPTLGCQRLPRPLRRPDQVTLLPLGLPEGCRLGSFYRTGNRGPPPGVWPVLLSAPQGSTPRSLFFCPSVIWKVGPEGRNRR